jgi:hypothetical protein
LCEKGQGGECDSGGKQGWPVSPDTGAQPSLPEVTRPSHFRCGPRWGHTSTDMKETRGLLDAEMGLARGRVSSLPPPVARRGFHSGGQDQCQHLDPAWF